MAVLKLYLGDVVQTRKTHPCGSDQWKIERLGADVGIRCLGCGRYVLMERVKLERRIRRIVSRPDEAAGPTATPMRNGAPARAKARRHTTDYPPLAAVSGPR